MNSFSLLYSMCHSSPITLPGQGTKHVSCLFYCFVYVLIGMTFFSIYRQSQSEKLSTRCNQLQEKLNMAISTLQQALGGINSQVSESVAKVGLLNAVI